MKKVCVIHIAILMFSVSCLYGQDGWVKTLGGSNNDVGYSVASTTDGGFILTGWTESNDGDFEGMKKGEEDVIVIKFSARCEVEWKKTIGGTFYQRGNSVKALKDDGYIVTGYTDCNDGDFDGLNRGAEDAFVVKMDALGNVQWKRVLGGSKIERAMAVNAAQDGGYGIVGYTNSWDGDFSNGNNTINNFFVAKLNTDGTVKMIDDVGGGFKTDTRGHTVTFTPDNGLVIGGTSNALPGFGLFNKNKGGFDCFIAKVDSQPYYQWIEIIGGAQHDECKSLSSTLDGGIIMTGYTSSSDGDFQSQKRDSFDIFIIRTDGRGNTRWVKTIGGRYGDYGACVTPTRDGGFVVIGHTESGDGDFVGMNKGQSDIVLVKTDAKGNVKWIRTYGGSGVDEGKSITSASDGSFFITGLSNSNDGDFAGMNKGDYDLFIMKLDSNGIIQSPTTVSQAQIVSKTLTVAPNPLVPSSIVAFEIESPSRIRIEVVNSIGEVAYVASDKVEAAGSHRLSIDTSLLVPGVYFIRMTLNGEIMFKSVVVAQ
jgi:hypothetical protein